MNHLLKRKKEFKKLNNRKRIESRIEKFIKKKGNKLYVKWKVMIIHLIAGLIKKTTYKMIQYFPKPYGPFGRDINVKIDLSNYATKTDLKGAIGIDTSNLAVKSNLVKLKAEVDKIDVDKLKTVSVNLSKLSNVVNNEVVKKTVHDKLVTSK